MHSTTVNITSVYSSGILYSIYVSWKAGRFVNCGEARVDLLIGFLKVGQPSSLF